MAVGLRKDVLNCPLGVGPHPVRILQIPAATKGLIKLDGDRAPDEFAEGEGIFRRGNRLVWHISRLNLCALLILKFGLVSKSNGLPLLR